MKLKKDNTDRKLRGAYYTPKELADGIVDILDINEKIKTILEPSCGGGVFIESILEHAGTDKKMQITAIEVDQKEAADNKERFQGYPDVKILRQDFFHFYEKKGKKLQYDLIIGNPPYIRYQYLSQLQRELQAEILISHGMRSNKLINAWVGFLVACVQMLSEHGKIAFVIPAEILQVAYAEDLRYFLSEKLSKITLLTFEKLVFPDIEQEVLVLIGEKGCEQTGIRIVELSDLKSLETLDLQSCSFQKLSHAHEKWTKYFTTSEETRLIQSIKEDSRFFRFSECGLINVGITTGNNRYFSVTEETVKEYDLADTVLPLIGRSAHASGIYFTRDDWERNVKEGKRAQLISFPDIPVEEYKELHRAYIKKGEKDGEDRGYKCSIRERWYQIPSVWIPDAFFLRRNNFYPKFVLNHCNAVSTDTMHRIKFKEDVDADTILLSYYNSISFAFTEICGRSYGGGVLEILPGELGNILLPKLEKLEEGVKKELLQKIDKIVRNQEDIEQALDLTDRVVLEEYLGISKAVCRQFRGIWKKLQKRRLGRG